MTSQGLSTATEFTSPTQLDSLLYQHISTYVAEFSFVKLEAALTEMVYLQFKESYQQADDDEKQCIEKKIAQYIPTREQLRRYIAGEAICFRRANTLANFFNVSYALNNHNPACDYQSE